MIESFVGQLLATALPKILVICWFFLAATFVSALTLPKGRIRNGLMIFCRWGFVMDWIGFYVIVPCITQYTEFWGTFMWPIMTSLGLAVLCEPSDVKNEEQ